MPEPITLGALSGIGSSLGGIVTAAKLVYGLKNTHKDVKACLQLVERVYDDIQYVVYLRMKHLKILYKSYTIDLARLDRIIADAERSILDVGRLLEPCRREAHGGKVPFMGRMEWVLGGSSALVLRTPNLQQQHAAIVAEIQWLRQLEALKPLQDFVESNTTYDNLELLTTRRRSSSKASSVGEGTRVAPPAYSPNAPTFQEEDDLGDSVSEIAESRFIAHSPSPSVTSSTWNTLRPSMTSTVWQDPAELPDTSYVTAPTSSQDTFRYEPFASFYSNGHTGSPSSFRYESSTPSFANASTSSLNSTQYHPYTAPQTWPSTATQNPRSGNPTSFSWSAQSDFTIPQTRSNSEPFFDTGGSHTWQRPSTSFQQPPTRMTGNETLEAEEEEDTQKTYFRDIARQQAERKQRVQERNRSLP